MKIELIIEWEDFFDFEYENKVSTLEELKFVDYYDKKNNAYTLHLYEFTGTDHELFLFLINYPEFKIKPN